MAARLAIGHQVGGALFEMHHHRPRERAVGPRPVVSEATAGGVCRADVQRRLERGDLHREQLVTAGEEAAGERVRHAGCRFANWRLWRLERAGGWRIAPDQQRQRVAAVEERTAVLVGPVEARVLVEADGGVE